MKLIKINAPINLNSGVVVPAASFVGIREAYFNNNTPKDASVTTQIAIGVYTTQAKARNGKTPIADVSDFEMVYTVEIPIADYTTKDAESVCIAEMLKILTPIYTAPNLSIITI